MWRVQYFLTLELIYAIYTIKQSNVNNHRYFAIENTSPAFLVHCPENVSNTSKDNCLGISHRTFSFNLDINQASSSFGIIHLWSGQMWQKHLPLSPQRQRNSVLHISLFFFLCSLFRDPAPPHEKAVYLIRETQSWLVQTKCKRQKSNLFWLISWEKTCRGQLYGGHKKGFLSGECIVWQTLSFVCPSNGPRPFLLCRIKPYLLQISGRWLWDLGEHYVLSVLLHEKIAISLYKFWEAAFKILKWFLPTDIYTQKSVVLFCTE